MSARQSDVPLTRAITLRIRRIALALLGSLLLCPAAVSCAPRFGSASLGDEAETATTIQIENHTSAAYRVTYVASGVVRTLGWVPALETRDFALPPSIVRANEDLQLLAYQRGSAENPKVSLRFHVPLGKTAKWTLDTTEIFGVIVR